jgi:two-component system LytT family response regulator
MAIRVVIADDEPLARKKLGLFLEAESDVQVVAECGDCAQTVIAVRETGCDLLFLDVQMPDASGFEVLQKLEDEETPLVIFTTAHDEYAVRAFEAEALDYLLKPFDRERLQEALSRARGHLALRDGLVIKRLRDFLSRTPNRSTFCERLAIRSAGRIVFLDVEEIDWIEAAANYVRVHAGKDFHLMRESIGQMAEKLDSSRFVRVHRSAIVNAAKIRELQSCNGGEYLAVLRNGKSVPCSRGYRNLIEKIISQGVPGGRE